LLSGTSFDPISWCHHWTTFLTLSRHTIGRVSLYRVRVSQSTLNT
jgi:hypothetical protein